MREIKFRGKLSYANDWVEGSLVRDSFTNRYDIRDVARIYYPVAPETIGEFIGVKDKNGKDVFEGDIVFSAYIPESEQEAKEIAESNKKGDYGYIEWREGKFVIVWVDYKYEGEPYYENNFFEVVGNIYDNTELLEESK